MRNLENYGVSELEKLDCQEANGGGITGLITAAFLLGRRVEYVKNGGGWFDFYL